MRQSNVVFVVASAAIAGLSGLVPVKVFAQTSQASTQGPPQATEKPYDWKGSFAKYPTGKVPRTRDGKPDLQGIWSHSVLTPLERPAAAQDKTEFSVEEAREAEDFARQAAIDLRVEPTATPPGEKTTDAYNSYWRDGYWYKVPMTTLHTSQVIDPPDGRVPPLIPAAKQRQQATIERVNRPATGPEDRPLSSRCVRPVRVGPPFTGTGPGSQESTFQIVQGRDVVVVRPEAHESQMIYLDGRARPPETVRLYKGAPRGHWEGDTLVVDSTNFNNLAMGGTFNNYGNTEKAHLIERWKRLDENHLLYGFTIEDPGTWTRPWSIEVVMWRLTDQEQLVEYACHEGNVGIEFTLSAARMKEREQQAEENGGQLAAVTGASREAVSNSAPRSSPEPSAVAYRTNDLGMEFVMVPAGEFQMGCSEGAKPNECSKDEWPRHVVQITKGFEIGKTEVTGKQWQAVMGSDPSVFKGEDLPVEQVSFGQTQEFLKKLNARGDGYLYRLPTEAEWEYAARAGTTDQYAGSLNDMAWYDDSRGAAIGTGRRAEDSPTGLAAAKTHPVATKQPNRWGIYDMRGNVAEWVQDFYEPNYYSISPAADPKGPPTGEGHVVRGGSFHVYPWLTRVSLRTMFPETYEFDDVGLRVVREQR
jgi:formylglycine-generating enzyme required for sulfatase activity